ncbi:hypothetical protein ABIB40_003767 [Pedobacter sp. UYP30]|uniref:hypothetical protein n=1 Tax=Pedobacter sp. UYP30 TaxID=1756400 RepID=UPI00339353C4
MRKLLYLIGVGIVFSIGCKRALKISNSEFNLVDPSHLEKLKWGEKCQFKEDNKVDIFTFKNNLGTVADLTVGNYLLDNGKLTFPKGTFDIEKVGEDYHLTSNGKLRYLLLTDTAYSRLKVQLQHLDLQQSEAAVKNLSM